MSGDREKFWELIEENHACMLVTHGPGGTFCYLFARHASRPYGDGKKYRATVIGPGVMPDVTWEGLPAGSANAADKARTVAAIRALKDPACRP